MSLQRRSALNLLIYAVVGIFAPNFAYAQAPPSAVSAFEEHDFKAESRLAMGSAGTLADPKAQEYPSVMYAKGIGVPKDSKKAVYWLYFAALNGVSDAQFSIGNMYENGENVPQNYVIARGWYMKAAEGGDYLAHISLSRLYAEGLGTAKDYIQALWALSPAAERDGGALARSKFASLCLMNDCGKEMMEKAYEYLAINSSRTRFRDQEDAISTLAQIAKKMSPEQISSARDRADRWEGEHPVPRPPL